MSDKIKEAIDVVKNCTPVKVENQNEKVDMFRDALIVLSDLAERYLAVDAEMPTKKDMTGYNNEEIGGKSWMAEQERNRTIEECALITTKLIAEKDNEIERLKKRCLVSKT